MSFVHQHYSPLTRTLSGRILELGCGRELKAAIDFTNAHLTAVDLSAANLRSARERERHRKNGHVDFVTASGEALPFPNGAFDAVIGSFVFCSVGDVDRVAAEMARVAKPSASLVLVEHVRSERPVAGKLQDALSRRPTPASSRTAT